MAAMIVHIQIKWPSLHPAAGRLTPTILCSLATTLAQLWWPGSTGWTAELVPETPKKSRPTLMIRVEESRTRMCQKQRATFIVKMLLVMMVYGKEATAPASTLGLHGCHGDPSRPAWIKIRTICHTLACRRRCYLSSFLLYGITILYQYCNSVRWYPRSGAEIICHRRRRRGHFPSNLLPPQSVKSPLKVDR